jgi:hypothetical protein
MNYLIYAMAGFCVWLSVGSLLLFVAVPGFYQVLLKLSVVQVIAYITCFLLIGSLTGLIQAAFMAKGARELSRWYMAGAPFTLGAVVGSILAILGPNVIQTQLGLTNAPSEAIIRLCVGAILGVVAVLLTTVLAAYERRQLGMRGPL